jgi:NAD(P)-dependent dehydrogenase (short-subunit alcohol dehydrogenase family)
MNASDGELAGKIAVVTGASRGIGRAIAETFARQGARVVICGRKQEALEDVARIAPERIRPVCCNVGRSEDVTWLVATTELEVGPIDIVVNNAATNIAHGFCLDLDETQFDKMVDINLKSTFRLMHLVGPKMCARGKGSVINVASVAGITPLEHSMLYSMTKAALIMLTKSYALELGRSGVRVNAIAPGFVETKLSEYYWKDDDRRARLLARQPVQHIAKPQEIADIAVLLASERSSYMTGHTVVVDGGLLLS